MVICLCAGVGGGGGGGGLYSYTCCGKSLTPRAKMALSLVLDAGGLKLKAE